MSSKGLGPGYDQTNSNIYLTGGFSGGNQDGGEIKLYGSTHATNANQILINGSGQGNIGMGTTTPGAKLSLAGTAGGTIPLFLISSSTAASATSTAFIIDANGKVGIGTNAPQYALDVAGSAKLGAGDEVMRLTAAGNVGIGTTSPSAKLHVGSAAAGANARIANGWLCVDDNDTCTGATTAGYIYAVADVTTGADYAEYFHTRNTDLESGELVCVDITRKNSIERCSRPSDGNLMGVVSTKPAIIGNNQPGYASNPNYKIIALLGQIPAKVSAENGSVRPGDSLTSASSTPGYAMLAKAGDPTVGVALEGLEEGKGDINILISRRNKSITVEQVEQEVTERIAGMEIEDEVNLLIASAVETLDLTDEVADLIDPKLLEIAKKFEDSLAQSSLGVEEQISRIYSKINENASTTAVSLNEFSNMLSSISAGLEKLTSRIFAGESGIKIGNNITATTTEVAVVEINALSDKPALVIEQEGQGEIAQFFNSEEVEVMTIGQTGKVTIMGELFVDGRIMVCSHGACSDALDSEVDETAGDMGVEGKIVAGGFENYCEEGFVWAPGSAKYGTMPGFCVMEDFAKYGENITERSSDVWNNLSQGEAQLACQALGSAYHLISDNEWMTIVENIIRVPENDVDLETPGLQLAVSGEITSPNPLLIQGGEEFASASSSPSQGEAPEGRWGNLDSFILSTGKTISIAGMGEWIDQTITKAGLLSPSSDDWREYAEIEDFRGFNIAPPYYLTSENGIGKIKITSEGGNLRAFVRGENGIFGLDLSHSPTELNEFIGFRCAK